MSEQPRLLSHFLIWFFRRPIFLPFRRREQMPGKESGGGHNYHAGQWQLADHDDHTDPGHLPGGDGGGRAEIEWTAAAGHGPEPGPGPGPESCQRQHACSRGGLREQRQGNQLHLPRRRSRLHHWRDDAASGSAAAPATASQHGQPHVQRVALAGLGHHHGSGGGGGHPAAARSSLSHAHADAHAHSNSHASGGSGGGAAAAAADAPPDGGEPGQPAGGAAAAGASEQHAGAAGQR